jgi:4-amino-4-deoxy-L-arabinose transferase-like glycosyltransferase
MGQKRKSRDKVRKHKDPGDAWTRIFNLVRRYDYIFIFLLIFFVYNITTRLAINGDTTPAAILPFLIIEYQTVYFDPIYSLLAQNGVPYQYVLTNGHYASIFPIVTPILITPMYLVHSFFITTFPAAINYTSLLAKFSATILAALAGTFVYLIAKKLFKRKIALITTIIFAFGTLTWAISSQTLWQHGTSELLLAIALFCIVRNEIKPSFINITILGIASGLFLFNRPPDGLLLIPILYYIWRNRDQWLPFVGGALISGLPFLAYNLATFGNLFGGYGENLNMVVTGMGSPLAVLVHFAGLLISPSRGLFIYSPILLFGIWGFYLVYKKETDNNQEGTQKKKQNAGLFNKSIKSTLLIFIPCIIGTILIYSAFSPWFGGWCFGPRFLIGFLPVLAIVTGYGIAPYLEKRPDTPSKKVISIIILVLIIYSVIVQAIGAWAYPYTDWDKGAGDQKVWDWSDMQIASSVQAAERDLDSVILLVCPSLPPPVGIIPLYIRG